MTSIPRDLLVSIPGVGDSVKINEAYANFGERGAVRAVKRLLSVDGEAVPDQPRDHRRLRRLQARDRLHRLRLRRHRPRLLQRRRRAGRLRRDRHRPRLPEALRQGRARLRALPPHRQRPRARRAPAGLPAPGAQREGDEGAARGRAVARQPQEAGAGVRALLRPRQEPGPEEGGLQVRQDRALHGRQPGARGALPRDRRARQGQPRRVRGDARARRSRSSWTRRPRRPRASRPSRPRPRSPRRRSARSARRTSRPRSRGSRRRAPRARTRRSWARARSTSRSTSRRCGPARRPTRARSRGPTRSRTSAGASTTPTGSCSPRASSASTTGSRA